MPERDGQGVRHAADTPWRPTAGIPVPLPKDLRTGHADHRIGCFRPDQRTVQQRHHHAEAIEIQGASEIDVDFDKELKNLVQKGALLKNEGREVEKLLMNNNPDDGVTGGATLWKLTQGITAFAREQQPERCRELHEISGQLMNRVKIN